MEAATTARPARRRAQPTRIVFFSSTDTMAEGATLQNYNSELVGCIEEVWRASDSRVVPTRRRRGIALSAKMELSAHLVSQLREKREELNKSIAQDEEEKGAQ